MKIGIVGLPNVGKSSLFQILTKKQVNIANYPFTTIEPNIAKVAVFDKYLEKLAKLLNPERVVYPMIEFFDIAGLVKEAAKGRGLGNQFLAKIREVDLILEVVRVFKNKEIIHFEGEINPLRDMEIIASELEKAGIKKPIIYLFNGNELSLKLKELIKDKEWFLIDLLRYRQEEIDKLVNACYRKLGLITFYTIKGGKEIRGVKLKNGSNILKAAEKIHSDFLKKFIKAEVVKVDQLLELGSFKKAKEKGLTRLEGKEYIVKDKDVIEFKIFNS